jgi:hypothetical protein
MAHKNRRTSKKAPAVRAPVGHSHGEEAIARLLRLAKHPIAAVSAAATQELLEMLCGRPMQITGLSSDMPAQD